ncbi:MAG: hypothetical protein AAF437_10420 [Pseudomonadota bacterium]
MPATQLRHMTLAWLSLTGIAQAQQGGVDVPTMSDAAGTIYEQSRQDVTLPIASDERLAGDEDAAVTIPVEDLATPMRCMTAWSYLAGRVIRTPDVMRDLHPDFTEATASAHWQHWLQLDLDAHQGAMSGDFHQRRLTAERAFSLSLAAEEEAYAYRTLGTCFVPPVERLIADPTLLLRNFMVEHQGLPEEYTIPVLQRQLRAYPISKTVEETPERPCDAVAINLQEAARIDAVSECFSRGGILASQARSVIEDLDGLCRATASVQCENIP